MKKTYLLSCCLLTFSLTACVNTNNEPYAASDELSQVSTDGVIVTEISTETEILPPCDSSDADCIFTNDFLTDSFTTEKEVVSFSRPVSKMGTSVKDKQQNQSVSDEQKSSETIVNTSSDPVVVLTKEVKNEETIVTKEATKTKTEATTIQQPKDIVAPTEKSSESTSSDSKTSEKDVISVSERVVPLKKVKTTITETTTRIQDNPETMTQEARTLLDKIHYGEEVHDWEASSGKTLRTLLNEWGTKSGWTVIWKLDRDYHLEAGVVFRGTFTDVSAALVRSFARATPAPIGTFYQGNRVLLISTQEDENAR